MAMAKHKIFATVALTVGALYLFHMWNSHGTFKQTLSGLGITR